jgi:hypothetical protein
MPAGSRARAELAPGVGRGVSASDLHTAPAAAQERCVKRIAALLISDVRIELATDAWSAEVRVPPPGLRVLANSDLRCRGSRVNKDHVD